MDARQLANDLLRRGGFEVRRTPRSLIRSGHELHLTLEHAAAHLAAFRPDLAPVVLQVGAMDGVTGDPLHRVLGRFRWRAVLVEPQPDRFALLQARYAESDEVYPVNVAIGATNGMGRLYQVDPERDAPDWMRGVASFDRDHLIRECGDPTMVNELTVPVWTFDDLLAKTGTERVDVLVIDAEGMDWELLRLFDVPRRLPLVVQYEHQVLSRSDRESAASMLVGAGYRVHMTHSGTSGDTLAVLDL